MGGLFGTAQVVLVCLKLTGIIDWPWLHVLAPLWFGLVWSAVLLVLFGAAGAMDAMFPMFVSRKSPENEAAPSSGGTALESVSVVEWIEVAGLPQIDQPVRVVRGRDVIEGIVIDAWQEDDPGLTIREADGVEIDLYLSDLQAMGGRVLVEQAA